MLWKADLIYVRGFKKQRVVELASCLYGFMFSIECVGKQLERLPVI